jgi:hypothetical protein
MASKPRYTGLGIALGAALGAAAGVLAGHVAMWLGIGVAIGMALGASFRGSSFHGSPTDCPECAVIHQKHDAKGGQVRN